jgi:hypothetical protein
VSKDWEVGSKTLGDEFFLFSLKVLNWGILLGTLGDALTPVLLGRPKALKRWCVNIKNVILKGLK